MDAPKTPGTQYLLAVDGSEHAHAAARLLSDLISCQKNAAQTCVQLLAVFTPVQATELGPLRQALQDIECIFIKKGVRVKSEISLGSAAEKIIEFAEVLHPALVVIGAKGLRATLGILLGGVAQQVVEYGGWPVLVVRAPYFGLHKTLVVTDGSACSKKAAEFLAKLSLPAGVEIHLLHVLPPIPPQPSLAHYAHAWPVGAEMLPPIDLEQDINDRAWIEEEEKQGREIIQDVAETMQSLGMQAQTALLRGDAATEIIEYARANGIELIVSGSRGLSTIKSWLLGSVSRKLVHYAGCSVLVVRETACN